jgi:hypothetical protein
MAVAMTGDFRSFMLNSLIESGSSCLNSFPGFFSEVSALGEAAAGSCSGVKQA